MESRKGEVDDDSAHPQIERQKDSVVDNIAEKCALCLQYTLPHFLHNRNDLLAFALISKQIFSATSPIINCKLWFRSDKLCCLYKPQKIILKLPMRSHALLCTHLWVDGSLPKGFFPALTHIFNARSSKYPANAFPQLQSISLAEHIDKKVEFPPQITHIRFGNKFNQSVRHLPPNVTHLYFGNRFNQRVNHLPASLTHLTFGKHFRNQVQHLPPNITHLTFGKHFSNQVQQLPPNITHLTFGFLFNQKVDHLPPHITHLIFSANFNQQVDNLPSNIIHLTFGYHFDQPVDHLPSSITHLTFGNCFTKSLVNLPSRSITHLTFCGNSYEYFQQTGELLILPPHIIILRH